MKKTLFILSLILTACIPNDRSANSSLLIHNEENIPLVNIDFSTNYSVIRKQLESSFEENLCEKCSWVYFKIPFEYQSQKVNLKLMTDYDSPYCSDCPIPMRYRFYYNLSINENNKILVEDDIVSIKSLQNKIFKLYQAVGINESLAPEKFNQINFSLGWQPKTSSETIEKVITEIINARLMFIEGQLKSQQKDLEALNDRELKKLKQKYPLKIELDLGKSECRREPNFKSLRKLENFYDEIINDKEIE